MKSTLPLTGLCAALACLPFARPAAAQEIQLLKSGDLNAWREPVGEWRVVAGATLSPTNRMRLRGVPGQGVLFNGDQGRTSDLLTRAEFGDVEAHVEFLVAEKSNSGIYFQGRYEVQILDSFGEERAEYPGNSCGGIYPRWLDNRNVGGHSPRVNASKPPGEWQSFDVIFRAPRFDAAGRKIAHARFEKVALNGTVVQQNALVTGPTRSGKFNDEAALGPLMVQGDHGPVALRNLHLRPLPAEAGPRPFTNAFVAMDTLLKQPGPDSAVTLEQQLDLVKAAGYAGVTWDERSPEDTEKLAAAAAARGLKLTALYCSGTVTKSNVVWNPTLPQTMARLKDRGVIIWLHLVSQDFAKSLPDGDAVAVPALRQLADLAAANGLRVALYPHVRDWTERLQDAVRVARRVGHPALGVTFNLCHCLMVGDEAKIPDLLTEAAPYLFLVSVNGADTNAAGTDWGRLIQTLDRGSFDLLPVLRKLQELEFNGPVALQGFGLKGDAADNLARSMTAWKNCQAKLPRANR